MTISVDHFEGLPQSDPRKAYVFPGPGVYLVVLQKDRLTVATVEEAALGLEPLEGADEPPKLADLVDVDPTGKIQALVEGLEG